jgi:dimethylsulfone monooxygenase
MSPALSDASPIADATVRLSDSPVFTSPNKMKLGVFATNLAGAASGMSTMDGPVRIANWAEQKRLAITADRAGFEALVPAT